jgi:hypothetical protein
MAGASRASAKLQTKKAQPAKTATIHGDRMR